MVFLDFTNMLKHTKSNVDLSKQTPLILGHHEK